MRCVLTVSLLTAAVVGCRSKSPAPIRFPLAPAPVSAQVADRLSGTLLEHLAASPYIYLRVKTVNGEVWAAVPEAKVEDGTVITVDNPMRMSKFESKALKRTFDEVYFGTLQAAPSGAAPGAPATEPVNVGQVDQAVGADARTVSEAWAERARLVGKTVTIRGRVVKYNEGVMGKNWIHLQDGTGDAKAGTNDITVTSLDGVAKGDVVTLRGTVHTNHDFGAGYSYAVIVEDAKLVRP